MLKSPYVRQGNKYPLLEKLIPFIPKHKIYVEPFFGSGALFFNIPNSDKSVLNDKYEEIIKMLKLLKKAPLNIDDYPEFNSLKEVKKFFNHHGNSIPDQIIYLKIKLGGGYMGKVIEKANAIYRFYKYHYFLEHLKDYKDKLKRAILLCQDYKSVIDKYDSPETFFFLDPPYQKTSKDFYKNTDIDYVELKNILYRVKGKFLLTINDSTEIRNIFKDFNIKKIKVKSQGWTDKDGKHMIRNELIITNYNIP